MYFLQVCCLVFITSIVLCNGLCPTEPLFTFIQSSAVATTMLMNGQYSLPADGINVGSVLPGAYVPMKCNDGYVLASGQLNITCIGNSWTTFPTCVLGTGSGSMTTTMMPSIGGGVPCTIDQTSTFNTTNGYPTNIGLTYASNTAATGSIQFACTPGYALDPSVGSSYVCNNGQWSTKPRCLITGRCSFSQLRTFTTTATGIQTTGQSSLMQLPSEQDSVLNGSFIVFSCISGYVNTGGSLNVTCGTNGVWNQFPNCVMSGGGGGGGGSMTTTMMASGGMSCTIDQTSTFNISNGYPTNIGLTYASNTAATGSIQFACTPGYALDPSVGSSYVCNNGQWLTKPRCLITGRCSFSQLRIFTTTATGIQTTGQSSLMQLPSEQDSVLNGSFIVFSCISGYVNTGGNLNVTCGTNGVWSQFPNCIMSGGGGSMTTTTIRPGGGSVPCTIDQTSTFNITNGYPTNMGLSYVSNTAATGSIQFACTPGYALDPSIGSSYVCNNGQWSTKPRCLMTGRCSFSQLRTFTTTATGIQTTGQSSLMQLPSEQDSVLNGSFIVFICISGYVNTGGSLNVTCGTNGIWSQFPNCVMSGGGGSMTTTTMMPGGGSVPCTIDQTSTFNITNGYPTNIGLSYVSNTAATGSIQFACTPGYALDPSVGSSYVCNNGQWSTKPRCLITGRCSFSQLRTFTTTATGIQTTGQSSLMQLPSEQDSVLNGSFIVFICISGYVNTGGSLNVTCGTNGVWSQFPNCVMSGGGGSMTTTTMMPSGGIPCVLDPTSTFNISNGYPTNIGLSYVSNTAATGSIQFACTPGYALDPSVGASYVCSNGQWSTKPRCLMTGRCSFSQLRTFTTTAIGIQTTGQSSLMQLPSEQDSVLNGSFIVFICISGYVNTGGSLNVTCGTNGVWSQFPNCVMSGGSGSMTTTTMMPGGGGGVPCTIDQTSTFNITNGYPTNIGLSYVSNTAATGSIQFACTPGYALDPSVGSSYVCNNGQWLTKPRCLITGRCSFTQLRTFTTTATGIQTTGQSSLMQLPSEQDSVLNGSFIVFICISGYVNTGGSLNVTCGTNGIWSQFPNCVMSGGGGGSMTTTTMMPGGGAPCVLDPTSTFNISNGYPTNIGLSYVSNTAATGSIQFACTPGYALDPSVGASYVCSNGQWLTKPRCLMTGRCSFSQLRTFTTTATGIQTTGQSSLMQLPNEQDSVLNGSFIVFICISGYVNTGGSLNVTCGTNGVWSQFPNCVMSGGGGSMTTTTIRPGGAPCVLDSTSTFNISNGYPTNIGLSYVSNTAATGSIQFACTPGYALDPSIGSSYVCNNGQWSTKPRCLMTGRCSFSQLRTFTTTATGIQTTGQSSLMQLPSEQDSVLNGSFLVFSCASGYVNTGGSLNVTCGANGAWSQFPNCVMSGGGGSMTTTTVIPGGGVPCVLDATSTFNITNGYPTNIGLSYVSNTAATGSIQFACTPGYVLDPSVGAAYVCNNGQWSTKPRCLRTGRCSFSQLRTFTTTTTGIQTTGQSSLMQLPSEQDSVLNGSFIVFICISGYINTGGSLNVTCGTNGVWSQFPNCVMSGGGGSMTTTTMMPGGGGGVPCTIDQTSTFNISNGYPTNIGLSYVSNTAATGSIQFACTPGYALDPSVGASYVCSNGQWSTKPRCLKTGRCSFSQLRTFTTTATGIQTTGQSSLMQLPSETDAVLNGSFIIFTCVSGYVNTGGSLNVTCGTNGAWSQFPNCVSTCGDIPVIANGYTANVTSIQFSNNRYQRQAEIRCNPGYVFANPSSQRWVSCTNGVWDQFPTCIMSSTCSLARLQAGLPVGMRVVSSSLVRTATSPDILAGGWLNIACSGNYKWNPLSGPLNITCLSTGDWTPFPVCIL